VNTSKNFTAGMGNVRGHALRISTYLTLCTVYRERKHNVESQDLLRYDSQLMLNLHCFAEKRERNAAKVRVLFLRDGIGRLTDAFFLRLRPQVKVR
jgi:hypothetical protein